MQIMKDITALLNYAVEKCLIEECDRVWAANRLIEALELAEYVPAEEKDGRDLEAILASICDYAAENGIMADNTVTYRDLFDTKIMGLLVPRPSEVIRRFNEEYAKSPEEATDYYYALSRNSDYIRTYRVKRDLRWVTPTEFGELDITVNLSKPEKDPKAIAAALTQKAAEYPKCLLCKENEGFAGHLTRPARQNHRVIPLTMAGEQWFMQYSPYVYYNEHCIAFNSAHTPMKINRAAFDKLLDFVTVFPHYFIGSNADLPIVGGSILTHDHFQGGRYEFAMAKAEAEMKLTFNGYEDVEAEIVKWPLSVIRLRHNDKKRVAELGEKILNAWRGYTDESAFIYAETNGEKHNTITPIARRRGGKYELDLVLRNNITTEEHPMGVYHPHAELHHIKKENIGLIEVMGLAVLPARLKNELARCCELLVAGGDLRADELTEKHADWAEQIASAHGRFNSIEEADAVLREEVGKVFCKVLCDAGVYKCTAEGREAFKRFADSVNA